MELLGPNAGHSSKVAILCHDYQSEAAVNFNELASTKPCER
jgi:hypothetical protein